VATVEEIVSDPAFARFSRNQQIAILRKLKGGEVAAGYEQALSEAGPAISAAPEGSSEPSLGQEVGGALSRFLFRSPEQQEAEAAGLATQPPTGQLLAAAAMPLLTGVGGAAARAVAPLAGKILPFAGKAVAAAGTPLGAATIGGISGAYTGGVKGAATGAAEGAILGHLGGGTIGRLFRLLRAAPALRVAAPAATTVAKAAVPAVAAAPAGREAFMAGTGKLAAMLGQAPAAERIAQAAAPATFSNVDAAIVSKIRQFAQMPGGKQKALKAVEQVFGKVRAKDMLREILRPRTTMPTIYTP